MNKSELLDIVLNDRDMRIAYFEDEGAFVDYANYHFAHLLTIASPPFHIDWARAMAGGGDVAIKGFRESGKTIWLMIYYTWCIAYKKRRLIMHYCYDEDKAEARLFDLITQLQTSETYIDDYGNLYPTIGGSKDKKQKAGVKEFITTNHVMVKAMGIGISPRGQNYTAPDGSFRPDLIGLDDIDVLKSV